MDTTIDTTRLNDRIAELHDAFIGQGQAGAAATIFADESRLFLKQIIRLTPPKTQKQGEAAIQGDLLKLFTPINEDMLNTIGSEHGLSAIDAWITTSGGERKELDWRKIDPTGEGMAAFHNANRNARGRTYNRKQQRGDKWYSPYVVAFQDFAAYREKIFARVGRRKAAWAKSFVGLGGKVSRWFDPDKKGLKGEFHNSVDPTHPRIVMINRAPGISQDLHFVRGAMRVRYQAIGKRMRLVLSGYSQDVARGIKLQRRVRATPESFQEAA